MDNKYLLAFLAVFFNVALNVFLKGGLGYKKDGIQVTPGWAKKIGGKPMEINIGNFRAEHIRALLSNVPFLLSVAGAFCFFISWISLISVAGLGFANAAMALFFVVISLLSRYLFDEYLGGLKLAGMIVIVLGFIFVTVGEYIGELQGFIE